MKRKDFMSEDQTKKMGTQARTHANCIAATGVARPGKTAHDRAKKERKAGGE